MDYNKVTSDLVIGTARDEIRREIKNIKNKYGLSNCVIGLIVEAEMANIKEAEKKDTENELYNFIAAQKKELEAAKEAAMKKIGDKEETKEDQDGRD